MHGWLEYHKSYRAMNTNLLVDVELAEDFGGIEEVSVVNDLLDVPAKERQVENQRNPISINEEKECQETVNSGLGNNVCVESVAEINGVNVITLKVAVHDGEKNL